MDSYLSQGYYCYMKCKQPRYGIEFVSLCLFPMYVCMYACMYICMYIHVCIYIYIYIYVCIYMYVCMYVCIYACMYICMYVCMNVCMYVCCGCSFCFTTRVWVSNCIFFVLNKRHCLILYFSINSFYYFFFFFFCNYQSTFSNENI